MLVFLHLLLVDVLELAQSLRAVEISVEHGAHEVESVTQEEVGVFLLYRLAHLEMLVHGLLLIHLAVLLEHFFQVLT